jgi:hypothetical protein
MGNISVSMALFIFLNLIGLSVLIVIIIWAQKDRVQFLKQTNTQTIQKMSQKDYWMQILSRHGITIPDATREDILEQVYYRWKYLSPQVSELILIIPTLVVSFSVIILRIPVVTFLLAIGSYGISLLVQVLTSVRGLVISYTEDRLDTHAYAELQTRTVRQYRSHYITLLLYLIVGLCFMTSLISSWQLLHSTYLTRSEISWEQEPWIVTTVAVLMLVIIALSESFIRYIALFPRLWITHDPTLASQVDNVFRERIIGRITVTITWLITYCCILNGIIVGQSSWEWLSPRGYLAIIFFTLGAITFLIGIQLSIRMDKGVKRRYMALLHSPQTDTGK